jgi:hypothetical protein
MNVKNKGFVMESEKIKIPVYNDLILKKWKLPVLENYEIVSLKNGEISIGEIGLQVGNEYREQYKKSISENPEYFRIKDEYMALINPFREKMEDQFIGGMPVQLEKDCLSSILNLNYYLTLKVDGTRHLMFRSSSGILYFIDRLTNIYYFKYLGKPVTVPGPSFLIDGELVQHKESKERKVEVRNCLEKAEISESPITLGRWEFLMFDILFYNGTSVMSQNYYQRYNLLNGLNLKVPGIDILLKTWYPIRTIIDHPDIYKFVTNEANKSRSPDYKLNQDGLILQPFDGAYVPFNEWNVYNNIQFKWKPPEDLTVDFKIRFNPSVKDEWWLITKSDQNYDVPQAKSKPVHAIIQVTPKMRERYCENEIVECKLRKEFNPQHNIFVPLRLREDKTEGNSLQTVMSTMKVILNPFKLDILKPALESLVNGNNVIELLKFYSLSKMILCSVDMFFNETEIKSIQKIYDTCFGSSTSFGMERVPIATRKRMNERREIKPIQLSKRNYELELRIFPYIKKGSRENITKFTYFYFLDYLKKSIKGFFTYSIDLLYSESNKTFRSTYSNFKFDNPVNMLKESVSSYSAVPTTDKKLYNNLTFKLSLATERSSTVHVALKFKKQGDYVYQLARIKERHSFQINELWRIDLTKVTTTPDITKLHDKDIYTESYELECEYTGPLDISWEDFLNSLNNVYKLILFNTSYC